MNDGSTGEESEQNGINGSPGLMVEHFCVEFGDPSCVVFRCNLNMKIVDCKTDKPRRKQYRRDRRRRG